MTLWQISLEAEAAADPASAAYGRGSRVERQPPDVARKAEDRAELLLLYRHRPGAGQGAPVQRRAGDSQDGRKVGVGLHGAAGQVGQGVQRAARLRLGPHGGVLVADVPGGAGQTGPVPAYQVI